MDNTAQQHKQLYLLILYFVELVLKFQLIFLHNVPFLVYVTDCYFFSVTTIDFNTKIKSKIEYSNLPSDIRPVDHINEIFFHNPTNLSRKGNENINGSEIGMSEDKQDKGYNEEMLTLQLAQNEIKEKIYFLFKK